MTCIVPKCPGYQEETDETERIRWFKIPDKYLELWCSNIKISPEEVKSSSRICNRHFHSDCFGSAKLKLGSMPTLNLGHDDVDRIYPTQLYTDTVVKTRTRRCHVKACRSTDPPDKLYFFPNDEEQRESWIVVCSVHRKYLQHKKLYICQRHFRSEMIGKQRLKKNAFPTLHLGDDEETEDDESDVWDSEDEEIEQKDVNWRNFEYIVKIEEVGD